MKYLEKPSMKLTHGWLVVFVCNPPFARSHAIRPTATFASIVLDTASIHSDQSIVRSGVRLAPPNPPINVLSATSGCSDWEGTTEAEGPREGERGLLASPKRERSEPL